jgi:wobble nucleotide-excising tRNase
MIGSIRVAKVATYGDANVELQDLSKINFIYGANAAGKTTLSNLISSPTDVCFSDCHITWKNNAPLEAMVYNRDFVARNFSSSLELKGIFTLGAKDIATIQAIEDAKKSREDIKSKLLSLTNMLSGEDGAGGKQAELEKLRAVLKEKCWNQKKKHDTAFQDAFAFHKVRGDMEKFLDRVLIENQNNTASVEELNTLLSKAKTIFGTAPVIEPLLPAINGASLLAHESNPILIKCVVGRDDVDIAAMIKKLGNSDWVKEGRKFFEINDEHCPFCQQTTPHSLEQSLTEYFDEAFIADTNAITDLQSSYKLDALEVQAALANLLSNPSTFFAADALIKPKEILEAKIIINSQKIAEKVREPSTSITLETLNVVLKEIAAIIDPANLDIKKHNAMVADLAKEKQTLVAQIWKYLIGVELKQDLADYSSKATGLNKAIESLKDQIKIANEGMAGAEKTIRDLEKLTTSTKPAVDAINATLSSFNFRSFKIAQAAGNTYKLVRADGADARATLSEGERTFVTFLYFYNLLKGSDTDSGTTNDRIVVFDDPVSSLDSDILFIVSTLIREVIAEARGGKGAIKQVFVLTHNVYFHKEVAYPGLNKNKNKNEDTFWTVRKRDLLSEVIRHESNPIKTSYELLWHDVRKPDGAGLSIQNTLRRIIESYFKILGGIDKEMLIAKVQGLDKTICASLMSWVNDGSHSVHDDLFVAADQSGVDAYLRAFHRIFYLADHESHYQMMMGPDYYVPLALGEEAGVAA